MPNCSLFGKPDNWSSGVKRFEAAGGQEESERLVVTCHLEYFLKPLMKAEKASPGLQQSACGAAILLCLHLSHLGEGVWLPVCGL